MMQLIVNNSKKVGRNDPCPCGSGAKYKKCCLEKDEKRARSLASLDPTQIRRDMESTLKKMAKVVEGKDMSVEELNEFLANGDLNTIDAEYSKLSSDDDPKSRAEDLLEQAFEASSCSKVVKLAKQALEIYPHLPDAWILIGEHSSGSAKEILPYFEAAVEAGKKDLGEVFFKENEGHFWGMIETRPFMRAKAYLAQALWDLGREDEAIVHYQECLKLNPNDNQGLRDNLVACLLAKDREYLPGANQIKSF